MKSKLQKNQKGFTIIEVLIVLAIAGLIILIVFLAVPALQRNSRNTQRKNDVSALMSALNETINNKGGVLPADNTAFTNDVESNAKLNFYDAAKVNYAKNTATPSPLPPGPTDLDAVAVHTYLKCADASTPTGTGASSRSVAALYRVETGGGSTVQCIEM